MRPHKIFGVPLNQSLTKNVVMRLNNKQKSLPDGNHITLPRGDKQ